MNMLRLIVFFFLLEIPIFTEEFNSEMETEYVIIKHTSYPQVSFDCVSHIS